jgi:hypothetical protein
LIHNFDINGYYYKLGDILCRKQLDIVSKDTNTNKPELMVVMMNPGSSKPLDGDDNGQKLTRSKPDNTQHQIVKLMKLCGLDFVRVLNLSDIRETKSQKFFKHLQTKNYSHSIFDNSRQDDFDKLFVYDVPVIFAWGVDKKLEVLANMAINKIKSKNPIGILKSGSSFAYYHPLPQNYHKQKQWLEHIYNKLKK